jgi:hypothetical protein
VAPTKRRRSNFFPSFESRTADGNVGRFLLRGFTPTLSHGNPPPHSESFGRYLQTGSRLSPLVFSPINEFYHSAHSFRVVSGGNDISHRTAIYDVFL